MNKVVLLGRLTRDPELRYTPNSIASVSFTIAVNRNYKNANGVRCRFYSRCCMERSCGNIEQAS